MGNELEMINRKQTSAEGLYSCFPGVAQDKRCWVGVEILMSPQLSAAVLEYFPGNERVTSKRLQVAERKAMTVVCA